MSYFLCSFSPHHLSFALALKLTDRARSGPAMVGVRYAALQSQTLCSKHYFTDGKASGKIKRGGDLTASMHLLPLERQGPRLTLRVQRKCLEKPRERQR